MSADHAHATPEVVELATGAIEAQQLADAIAAGRMSPEHAWLAFVELQARWGRHNLPVLRGFVVELAKRVRGANA
jgi:hypothetical protein